MRFFAFERIAIEAENVVLGELIMELFLWSRAGRSDVSKAGKFF